MTEKRREGEIRGRRRKMDEREEKGSVIRGRENRSRRSRDRTGKK
jgi:hypothetical protein